MVCIYCGGSTAVTNSRLQRRSNSTWRRRNCAQCGAIFTTLERPDYLTALSIRNDASHIVPFERDQLYVSLYEACRHRATATTDASALLETILLRLMSRISNGSLTRTDIITAVQDALKNFDEAAYMYYSAYHKS